MADSARETHRSGHVADFAAALAARGLPAARAVAAFRRPHLAPFLGALVVAVAVGVAVGVKHAKDAGPAYPDEAPVPVVLGRVAERNVPIYLSGPGTVQAHNTVQVRSRVEGKLLRVLFREGQEVHQGDVLAVVDSRRLEARLEQSEAALAQNRSRLQEARSTLKRLKAAKAFASRQSVEAQAARVHQLEAQLDADRSQVDLARAQLADAVITAPIDGRTGLRGVDEGNTVRPDDAAPIVTVTQLRPVSVLFSLSADTLPAVRAGLARGTLPVAALSRDSQAVLGRGRLELVDNQGNSATGTATLKASFPNEDLRLWPGQLVNARLELATRLDGLIVPAGAVQQGSDGPFVWVVDRGERVIRQPVRLGLVRDGEALVDGGLKAGQTVVVDGQSRLQEGSRVEPATPPGPA